MRSLTTLRDYFIFVDFIVHTDQSRLSWLRNVTDPSGSLIRWNLHLTELRFEVQYKKGILNSQVNAVSRLPMNDGAVLYVGEDEIPCLILGIEIDHETLESHPMKNRKESENDPDRD